MLSRLYIKNIALISQADIEFDAGLNVLSGETGSGKSVVLDSINFVLGSKADRMMIRYGESEAVVRAEFIVSENGEAAQKLKELDIDCDGNIVISRRLGADGKGAIKINGNSVTASMLKSVTQHLVDVHGQSEHFFLLSEDNQLKVIDGILGADGQAVKAELSSLIADRRRINAQIKALGGDGAERERKIDLLKFQIAEIENAGLREGEFENLKTRQNVLANTEKIISAINAVRSCLSDDGGCIDGISSAIHSMNGVADVGEEYANILSRLEGLSAEATDISETLGDMSEDLVFDGREAEEIDSRLSLIKELKRKYGADETEILAFAEKARTEFDLLSDGANAVAKLNAEAAACDDGIYSLCRKLTDLRVEAAKSFCRSVTAELRTLNIPDANFEVSFVSYDRQTANLLSSDGSDSVSFMFSANKGEPLKPLNKVISGGEMSRFMLAVKTRLKNVNGISTYIFDEIDAGISGFTAASVAEKFSVISRDTQILAVSHLPQVCAAGNAQFLIFKEEENGKTLTKIRRLDGESRVEEIMRLTGSVNSEAAKKHAEELIAKFRK